MKQIASMPVSTVAKVVVCAALLAAASGLAFASWMNNGAGIFMAMIENGLAWCF